MGCLFEPEILRIAKSSFKMYSNNILSFQESTTIFNACTKNSVNLLKETLIFDGPQIRELMKGPMFDDKLSKAKMPVRQKVKLSGEELEIGIREGN